MADHEAQIRVPLATAREHPHPGPKEYVKIAVVLAVVTALEVGIYYMKLRPGLLTGLLLFFSAIKFTLVVLWFMHLRFDSRLFRRLFVLGLGLAAGVYASVLLMFFLHKTSGA